MPPVLPPVPLPVPLVPADVPPVIVPLLLVGVLVPLVVDVDATGTDGAMATGASVLVPGEVVCGVPAGCEPGDISAGAPEVVSATSVVVFCGSAAGNCRSAPVDRTAKNSSTIHIVVTIFMLTVRLESGIPAQGYCLCI